MRITISEEMVLHDAHPLLADRPGAFAWSAADPDPTPERQVVEWLAQLRLLRGIPFEYLIPDEGLLRPETMRFFHLDRNWTDVIVEGALSAGTFGTRDRTVIESRRDEIRAAVDDAERGQWLQEPVTGSAATPAGFLLRSRAVSGWPALEAVGFRNGKQLALLRMERLAPAVLLVIFDNIPDAVELREPRQGIQFGVISSSGGSGHEIPVRTVAADGTVAAVTTGANDPQTGKPEEKTVKVPFRRGAAGVINVEDLAEAILDAEGSAGLGTTLDSAEFAMQMLRYPVVQRFADTGVPEDNNAPKPWMTGVLEGSLQVVEATQHLKDLTVQWKAPS